MRKIFSLSQISNLFVKFESPDYFKPPPKKVSLFTSCLLAIISTITIKPLDTEPLDLVIPIHINRPCMGNVKKRKSIMY